jgi:succinyl-CoA synthetase alpha subunit
VKAFQAAGVPVADRPSEIPQLLAERLKPALV